MMRVKKNMRNGKIELANSKTRTEDLSITGRCYRPVVLHGIVKRGNALINREQLKEMCAQSFIDKAYYRPYICNGDINDIGIFCVGANPATPIYPSEMDLGEYIQLLNNYDQFMAYYKTMRGKQGKPEYSRTRVGINSFMSWLRQQTSLAIMETNVNSYPTAKLEQLKREPKEIIEKGRTIFKQLLLSIQPKLIIFHGKDAVMNFCEVVRVAGLRNGIDVDLSNKIEQMEEYMPLTTIKYPDGSIGTVLACRHFMYYGKSGDSFANFRSKIQAVLYSWRCNG